MLIYVLLALVVFGAFLVEAALGFGATVVAVALGAHLVTIKELLPAFVPLNILLSAFLVARYRSSVSWRLLLCQVVPLMALGMPAGWLLFRSGSAALLTGLFGGFVVLVSAVELWRMARPAGGASESAAGRPLRAWSRWLLLVAGGAAHGAWATGGPMAVYVTGRQLSDKGAFRATLSCLWLILNAFLLVGYALSGDLCAEAGRLALVLLGPLVVGLLAGEWLHHRANARVFRAAVFVLLLSAGALLAATGG